MAVYLFRHRTEKGFIEPTVKLTMKEYKPNPTDTSDIELPQELLNLAEKLAENVHDVWAEGRMAQGWTYGVRQDEENRKTPCLVAFQDLPESEKAYDRNTALSTLRLIVKLGYKITKEI